MWTDKRVISAALNDAIDWNHSLLDALSIDDEHFARVEKRLSRMYEVRRKYFGDPVDPLAGVPSVSIYDLMKRTE